MPDLNERETKLVQYLDAAYGKETELEQALQGQIGMTTLAPRKAYKKRLQQQLKETKSHARELQRRIKKIGGSVSPVDEFVGVATATAGRVVATAKAPLHAVRGTS